MRGASAMVPSLLLVALLSAPSSEIEQAAALAIEAQKASQSGQHGRSLSLLRRAYALDPAAALLNNIGAELEQLGRYAEAADAYRQVLADLNAPPQLQALDRERLRRLEPRLGHAYLAPPANPELQIYYGQGQRLEPETEVEIPPPGCWVAIAGLVPHGLVLHRAEVELGQRRVVEPPSSSTLNTALIGPPEATRLIFEDLELALPPGTRRLLVPEGPHSIELAWSDGSAPLRAKPAFDRTLELLPVRPAVTAPPASPPPPAEGARWPWISVGGGVVAGTVAGLLLYSAGRDVAQVDEATQDGWVVGLSRAEVEDLDQRAANKGYLAAGLGLGALLAIGIGVVGWALDGPSSE